MGEFSWIPDYKKGYTEISRLGYYNTKEWKQLRALKLSANPICEICNRSNVLTPATLVDHIVPITKENIARFYEYGNLQSLCENCHRQKTRNSKYTRLKDGAELKKELENWNE